MTYDLTEPMLAMFMTVSYRVEVAWSCDLLVRTFVRLDANLAGLAT